MELTSATITRHAKGAWPRFDGAEMTHSADGRLLSAGETLDFTISRHFNRAAPMGTRTEYLVTLWRMGSRRELTAARWESIKADLRRAFKAGVEEMASDPTPRGVPFTLPRFTIEAAGDKFNVMEGAEIANAGLARGFASVGAARTWIREYLANETAETEAAPATVRAALLALATVANETAAALGETGTCARDEMDSALALAFAALNPGEVASPAGEIDAAALGETVSRLIGETAAEVRRDNVEYHAGRAAFSAGETLDSCPYLAGGERAARWALGWNEADTRPHFVAGRSVDGAEYLTRHGFGADFSEALVMSPADAREIASREEAKAKATRSPDNGVYGIKALPWDGPRLYTLADYDRDAREAAELDAYLAAQS